jgi:hypothetical protein
VFDKPQCEALAMGVGLIVNGLGYLANSFTGLLLPHYANTVAKLTFPTLTGEVAFVLWLLIRGVKSGMPSKSAGVSFNAVPLEQSSEKGSY